ncbi:hypothetical protein Q1695_000172 [Nippostrongylus brasiliensis]|nr:hypothetical protein Q1695_000172 [Nippostrongylus brasiliensis]
MAHARGGMVSRSIRSRTKHLETFDVPIGKREPDQGGKCGTDGDGDGQRPHDGGKATRRQGERPNEQKMGAKPSTAAEDRCGPLSSAIVTIETMITMQLTNNGSLIA